MNPIGRPHLFVVPLSEAATEGAVIPTTRDLAAKYVHRRWQRGELAPTTAKTHRDVLRGFASAAPRPDVITRRSIDRWFGQIRHLSPGTRRLRWSVVRGFTAHLHGERIIGRDPMAGYPAPKVPKAVHRALDDSQVEALYRACATPRDTLLVTLGVQLGLRRGEIARLEVGSFTPDLSAVLIVGKGGHERALPVTQVARADLLGYLSWAGVSAGPLVRGDRYPEHPVRPDWVGRQFARIAYDAGVKARPGDGVAVHAMRHHAATSVYQSTRDVLAVRDMLGHSSLQTTQVYVRGLDTEGLREAMEGRTYRRLRTA